MNEKLQDKNPVKNETSVDGAEIIQIPLWMVKKLEPKKRKNRGWRRFRDATTRENMGKADETERRAEMTQN